MKVLLVEPIVVIMYRFVVVPTLKLVTSPW